MRRRPVLPRAAAGALAAPAALAALAAVAAAVLAGCTVGPAYRRPPAAAPEQFYGLAGQPAAASLADLPWWEVFQDPVLKSLIGEALEKGYDVRIATARVEEARARYGIAGADLYPQVGYQGQFARERFSGFQPGAPAHGASADVITANVNVSWEIDLWGRIRRLTEAAKAQYLASEEARRGVALTLVSEVAAAYFDLRQLDEDLEIARRTTAAFHDTFDLFNRQLQGGVASALETSDAEASWATEAAQVPELENQIAAKENQLSLLLGRSPGPIPRGAELFGQPMRAAVPAGLPSALLLRRPDLRQFEQQLIAANANVGASEAAFFPAISLTGMFGGLSPDLRQLLGKGQTWSIAAGLTGPIFQGGRLRSQAGVARAQFEQARLQYEQGVTNALGEVSTSLLALEKLAAAEQERQRAVNAYKEAVRLSLLRYDSGLSRYFEVITAQESLLNSENGLAQVRHDRLVAMVNFYKALGGGWQVEEPAKPAAAASSAAGVATAAGPAAAVPSAAAHPR
ncbi:MAG TPA: efflux transporter outer membrane subunit [Thermoanaerobaculia bacterium]|nr:efflux transporter outer membrane subunit [Thermoanaerobaculia bacterium]